MRDCVGGDWSYIEKRWLWPSFKTLYLQRRSKQDWISEQTSSAIQYRLFEMCRLYEILKTLGSRDGWYLGFLIEWIFCWIEYSQIFESIFELSFTEKNIIKWLFKFELNFGQAILNWILNWIIYWQNLNIELNQIGYRPKFSLFCYELVWLVFSWSWDLIGFKRGFFHHEGQSQ